MFRWFYQFDIILIMAVFQPGGKILGYFFALDNPHFIFSALILRDFFQFTIDDDN